MAASRGTSARCRLGRSAASVLYSRWPRGAERRCWRGHFPGNPAPSPPERGLRYFRMETVPWPRGWSCLAGHRGPGISKLKETEADPELPNPSLPTQRLELDLRRPARGFLLWDARTVVVETCAGPGGRAADAEGRGRDARAFPPAAAAPGTLHKPTPAAWAFLRNFHGDLLILGGWGRGHSGPAPG